MDTGFEAWHLYTACKLTMNHFYEPNDHRYQIHGTGFLTQFPSGDPRIALVTNRHLADVPWAKPKYAGTVLESVELEMWQSENFRLHLKISDVEPLFHEDDSIDISVLPIGPAFDTATTAVTIYDSIDKLIPNPNTPAIFFNHAMTWDYLLKCENLWSEVRPGELVAFPGYPTWFDKLQTRPVFRSGMIASDPKREYRQREGETTNLDGNQQILFDAFSTSGNSGSPVFVAQRGLPPLDLQMKLSADDAAPKQAAKLEFKPYHQSFLIGINAGHFNDTDSERANDHAGLSRMFKLSAIMEILRTNTLPSDAVPQASILIPKDGVDAYGGFPADYFSQEPESSPDDADSRDRSILALRSEGKPLRTIAAEVGCSTSTVSRVIKRLS
jgi:hypothetical protein